MIRRKFLSLATLAGIGGFTAIEGMDLAERRSVAFQITGFTCITCAVGLQTLLEKERGVIRANVSYPESSAVITYHPALTSEAKLAEFIATTGFKATRQT